MEQLLELTEEFRRVDAGASTVSATGIRPPSEAITAKGTKELDVWLAKGTGPRISVKFRG